MLLMLLSRILGVICISGNYQDRRFVSLHGGTDNSLGAENQAGPDYPAMDEVKRSSAKRASPIEVLRTKPKVSKFNSKLEEWIELWSSSDSPYEALLLVPWRDVELQVTASPSNERQRHHRHHHPEQQQQQVRLEEGGGEEEERRRGRRQRDNDMDDVVLLQAVPLPVVRYPDSKRSPSGSRQRFTPPRARAINMTGDIESYNHDDVIYAEVEL